MTHYLDSSARESRRGPDLVMYVGTWCGDFVKAKEATTIATSVDCPRCRAAMEGRPEGSAPAAKMIDAAVRSQVEEGLRFLRAGATLTFWYDDHEFAIVRLDTVGHGATDLEFLIACVTCSRLVARSAVLRRAFPTLHKHTEE